MPHPPTSCPQFFLGPCMIIVVVNYCFSLLLLVASFHVLWDNAGEFGIPCEVDDNWPDDLPIDLSISPLFRPQNTAHCLMFFRSAPGWTSTRAIYGYSMELHAAEGNLGFLRPSPFMDSWLPPGFFKGMPLRLRSSQARNKYFIRLKLQINSGRNVE